MKTFISDLSGKEYPVSEKVSGKSLRRSIIKLIEKENPHFTPENVLSIEELDEYREKYVSDYLKVQLDEIDETEKTVLESITGKTSLTSKLEEDEEDQVINFGQRLADNVATFGGSWTFIISFSFFILIWISLNVFWFLNKGFDPYPFILLNLVLSCLAAIQAPVIMMSQNRQEARDRLRAINDYQVNLKAELEIRLLHQKIDHMLSRQWERLAEIQEIQLDLIHELKDRDVLSGQ